MGVNLTGSNKSKFDYSEVSEWLQANQVFLEWVMSNGGGSGSEIILVGGNFTYE